MILEFAPVGGTWGHWCPQLGESGVAPHNILVNLGHHIKIMYKVSEFSLKQKLGLEFVPVGGTWGQWCPQLGDSGMTLNMIPQYDDQLWSSYQSNVKSFRILAHTEAWIRICPNLWDLGAVMPPAGGVGGWPSIWWSTVVIISKSCKKFQNSSSNRSWD